MRTSSFLQMLLVVLGLAVSSILADEPYREASAQATGLYAGPWNMSVLKQPPSAAWGVTTGLVQEVIFESEPYAGKPTRVFAYVARPQSEGRNVPGMVLVHGGGGHAFSEWATLWANRGYAAIAVDLSGCGPDGKPFDEGGPLLVDTPDDAPRFRSFTAAEANEMWTYHAVAAVVRAHSLLASCDGVDSNRIGITGISWGGYLTCIVAGIDDRLKATVPVYGCGFLYENSYHCWLEAFYRMEPDAKIRWISLFDPSSYLPRVRCPIFFVSGTNDFAYPLDSYQKSYQLIPGPMDLRLEINMPHGHEPGWAPLEIGLFVDSILAGSDPLPRPGRIEIVGDRVSSQVVSKHTIVKAELCCTTDTGPWQSRKWTSAAAEIKGQIVDAKLPEERPLVCFLNVTDQRGATTSTPYAVLPEP